MKTEKRKVQPFPCFLETAEEVGGLASNVVVNQRKRCPQRVPNSRELKGEKRDKPPVAEDRSSRLPSLNQVGGNAHKSVALVCRRSIHAKKPHVCATIETYVAAVVKQKRSTDTS
jgi:hypothetical protein